MNPIDKSSQIIPINVSSICEPKNPTDPASRLIPIYVSSICASKVEAYIKLGDLDPIAGIPYYELINDQIEKKLPSYNLALVQSVNSSPLYCYDAKELSEWTVDHWTNPLAGDKIGYIYHFTL